MSPSSAAAANSSSNDNNSKTFDLAPDLSICRIVNGMWQVAGGHGHIDRGLAVGEMAEYHAAGFTTWDMADIYGPAEEFIGEFRKRLSDQKGGGEHAVVVAAAGSNNSNGSIQALTKWVPEPSKITRQMAERAIGESLRRTGASSLDLVQLHWWDYNNPYYIDALKHLFDLHSERGTIRHVGLTNFDTERMEIIMKDSGFKVLSNQVQYSIIDRRPEVRMAKFCQENNASLLAYGTLCGGLLSERYLDRREEPSLAELDTLSLRKYRRMIDAWGGWKLFQELLMALHGIAKKHRVSIANVATRYILDKPAVAAVIIGARLGIAEHRNDNARVFGLELDAGDCGGIDDVCGKSNDLFEAIGDCGDEYR